MKFRYLVVLLSLSGAFLGHPAQANSTEAVTNFAQMANLDHSGTMAVTDAVDYDFAGTAPHPIQFSIPLTYHDDQGREFRIQFNLKSVSLDGRAISIAPTVSPANATIILPAGKSAVSTRSYQLSYTLTPVIMKGTLRDILQRSITGSGWTVPINRATLRLDTHTAGSGNLTCFTGSQGTTTGSCETSQEGTISTVNAYAPLNPGEGLTILTDFPPGSFAAYLRTYESPQSYIWLFIIGAIIVLTPMIILGRLLYNKANDASKNQAQRN